MINYKHEYRVREKATGIAIDIQGYIKSINEFDEKDNCSERKPGVWIYINDNISIDEEETKCLLKGIDINYHDILKYSPFKKNTLIIIDSLIFNYCYFQLEGLTAAMVEWIALALNFDSPYIKTSFSKEEDEFVFVFPTDN